VLAQANEPLRTHLEDPPVFFFIGKKGSAAAQSKEMSRERSPVAGQQFQATRESTASKTLANGKKN